MDKSFWVLIMSIQVFTSRLVIMKNNLFIFIILISVCSQAKIIGGDNQRIVNSMGTNVPFKYHQVLESVGLLSMGCTATHIGYGLVITAGHCFAEGKNKFKRSCYGDKVYWGLREGKSATQISNCKQILVIENTDKKDYALILVDKPPRVYLPIKLDGRVPLGTRVTIFSHPFQQPLTWAGICETRKAMNSLWPLSMIHHQCDTNVGSSGAAILDANTLEIVGIHDGGWVEGISGYNKGTYIDDTYIPIILSRMRYHRPN